MQETRWTFIRHAPVKAPPGVVLGRLDVAADLDAAADLPLLAACLPQNAVRLTSPLARARATATALIPAGAELIEEPGLIEQDFGDWQGMTHDEIAAYDPAGAAAFWRAPMRNAPPGGEAFTQVVERVSRVLTDFSARFPGRDIVAVAHDGSIRAALCVALDIPPESAQAFRLDYLSLTRLDHLALTAGGAAWRIAGVNRAA
jgi:alpha-ribazole phosphatase